MAFKTETPQDRFVTLGMEIAEKSGALTMVQALSVIYNALGLLDVPQTQPQKKPRKPRKPKPKYEERKPADPTQPPKPRRVVNRDEAGKRITLLDAIKKAVEVGAEISPKEAAELVTGNGYKTASPNVPQICAVQLNKSKDFEQVKRGLYKRVA
jgi:hypothetical protein